MERFREIVLTGKGFWYKSYEQCFSHKRISPRSYRAGEEAGYIISFISGSLLCIMIASLIVGVEW